MDVFEAIERRASVRSFKDPQITDKELEAILRAAERAPRIGRLDILALQDKEKINRISDAAKREMIRGGGWNASRAQAAGYNPLYGSPTVIMMCGNPKEPFLETTIGIAVGMMLMAATALGLGSVTVSSIRHGLNGPEGPELRKLIGLTGGDEVIMSLAVGYTDDPKKHEMKGASGNRVRIVR
jgi:nitroreductase